MMQVTWEKDAIFHIEIAIIRKIAGAGVVILSLKQEGQTACTDGTGTRKGVTG